MKAIRFGVCAAILSASTGAAFAELPEMKAEYVGQAQYMWENKVVDATIRAKGKLLRVDIPASELGTQTGATVIMDFDNERFLSFSTGDVPANMRFYMEMTDSAFSFEEQDVVAVGTDKVAGLTCTKYEFVSQSATGEIPTNQTCISSKGIWLRAIDGEDEAVFEMKTIKIGSQPASLFEPPAGYSKMDMESFGDFGLGDFMKTDEEKVDDGDSKVDQVKDETKQQVEDRVDDERRKQVDKFLGKIFGN